MKVGGLLFEDYPTYLHPTLGALGFEGPLIQVSGAWAPQN